MAPEIYFELSVPFELHQQIFFYEVNDVGFTSNMENLVINVVYGQYSRLCFLTLHDGLILKNGH